MPKSYFHTAAHALMVACEQAGEDRLVEWLDAAFITRKQFAMLVNIWDPHYSSEAGSSHPRLHAIASDRYSLAAHPKADHMKQLRVVAYYLSNATMLCLAKADDAMIRHELIWSTRNTLTLMQLCSLLNDSGVCTTLINKIKGQVGLPMRPGASHSAVEAAAPSTVMPPASPSWDGLSPRCPPPRHPAGRRRVNHFGTAVTKPVLPDLPVYTPPPHVTIIPPSHVTIVAPPVHNLSAEENDSVGAGSCVHSIPEVILDPVPVAFAPPAAAQPAVQVKAELPSFAGRQELGLFCPPVQFSDSADLHRQNELLGQQLFALTGSNTN
jgi:hypothetical protein